MCFFDLMEFTGSLLDRSKDACHDRGAPLFFPGFLRKIRELKTSYKKF